MSETPQPTTYAELLARLTPKQRVFVEEFLDCLNRTEAARRAEYADPRRQGSRLMADVDIAAAIRAGYVERAMPADEVIARLSAIARADIRDLLRFDDELPRQEGDPAPAGELAGLKLTRTAPLHLIKKLSRNKYGLVVELHDQQAALASLARHHLLLGGIDWSKVPQPIMELLAEGKITTDDLRRLTTPGAE